MKKHLIIILSICLGLCNSLHAQLRDCGEVHRQTIVYNGCNSTNQFYVYFGTICTGAITVNTNTFSPWLSHTVSGSNVYFTVTETNVNRSAIVQISKGGAVIGLITINQTNTKPLWYPDTDGDGLGDLDGIPVQSCNPIVGYADNNSDWCPDQPGSLTDQGCPIGQTPENLNWTTAKTYDITGVIKSSSKIYFDDFGKPTQSQTYDTKLQRTWASQTLYDNQGRPALSSMRAPVTDGNTSENFQFQSDFIKKTDGNTFTSADLETGDIYNPPTIGNTPNTLGWYYSNANTDETLQDITNRPYNRKIYSKLTPGTVKKVVGGNKVDTNGDGVIDDNDNWIQDYSFSMPAAQEIYYAHGYNTFPSNPDIQDTYEGITTIVNDPTKKIAWLKASKTVVEDVSGVESVVFIDSEGKALGTARAGINERTGNNYQYEVLSLIGAQNYIDIHIPKGCGNTLSFLGSLGNYKVYNLKADAVLPTSPITLPAGFYRIEYTGNETLTDASSLSYIDTSSGTIQPVSTTAFGVRYKVNYHDFSLNYYNETGLLTASLQPLGFNNAELNSLTATVNHNTDLLSEFEYNALEQLTYSKDPDEGEVRFRYRKDGLIRFSQNSKQLTVGEFSYTNYDNLGRPIESGVATGNFSTLNPDATTFTNSGLKEQHFTTFDNLASADLTFLGNIHSSYANPSFLSGNVAKTENKENGVNTTSKSYYSYDIHGRVQWIIQDIVGLGAKTLDYEYDPVTGQITKVIFQKHVPSELFVHRYTYDTVDNSLVKVETSTNNSTFSTHADYEYYETGALKRTEIANGIQGIDYVYNLAGQLKAINHPNLTANDDPGGDATDLFGMTLDYHLGDYKRQSQFSFPNNTVEDQYNGNIKSMTWKTNQAFGDTNPTQYLYEYNQNNWLTDATFNPNGNVQPSAPADLVLNSVVTINPTNAEATNSITLNNGFEATSNIGLFTASIVDDTGGSFGTDDYKVYGITYDANGNIKSLNRKKNTEAGSNRMDELTYSYKTANPNQLDHVQDAVNITTNANDLKTQAPNNYVYNSIGQLTENAGENVRYEYNANGLVTKILYNNQLRVAFSYDDKNYRTRKESYVNGNLQTTTHYVLDAAGSVMAIYENNSLKEHSIYGANRLGIYNRNTNTSIYQLTDHLGNVRAVIESDGAGNAAALVHATDYYPFGMVMPNRQIVGGQPYRYTYQGQEKDPETGKEAFQLRLWDGRIGRWLTTDPYGQYSSPYLGMGNNPISMVDPDGGFATDPGDPHITLDEVVVSGKAGDGLQPVGISSFDLELSIPSQDEFDQYEIYFNQRMYEEFLSFYNLSLEDQVRMQIHAQKNQTYIRAPKYTWIDMWRDGKISLPFNSLFNSSSVQKLSYETVNDFYVVFQSFLSPKKTVMNLDRTGIVVGSNEFLDKGVNVITSFAPSARGVKGLTFLKTMNAAQFSRFFRGNLARLKPKLRGIINRFLNKKIIEINEKTHTGEILFDAIDKLDSFLNEK